MLVTVSHSSSRYGANTGYGDAHGKRSNMGQYFSSTVGHHHDNDSSQ